ncbi:MAG: hypothetical protein IAE94_06390 [Chthoniobacterales bacterium]|nr:hypothetical protein [Chthoniobacterales bacterium]
MGFCLIFFVMKTLIIFGNAVGGVGTTTTAVHISAALQTLGFSVRLLDGDVANRTATRMCPSAVPVDLSSLDGMRQIFSDLGSSEADTCVLDAPVSAHAIFKRFFTSNHLSPGIHLLVGTVIDQTEYSVAGAVAWMEAFPEEAENFLIVNSIGTPEASDARRRQLQSHFAGRVVKIPKLGEPNARKLNPEKAIPFITPFAKWMTGLDQPNDTD